MRIVAGILVLVVGLALVAGLVRKQLAAPASSLPVLPVEGGAGAPAATVRMQGQQMQQQVQQQMQQLMQQARPEAPAD